MKKILLAVFVMLIVGGEVAHGANLQESEPPQPNTALSKEGITDREKPTNDAPSERQKSPTPEGKAGEEKEGSPVDTEKEVEPFLDQYTYLQLLIGGMLLIAGILLGYFIGMLVGRKEKKRLHKEIFEKTAEIAGLKKSAEVDERLPETKLPKTVLSPEPSKPAPPNHEGLVKKMEEAIREIEMSIEDADPESQLTKNIQRSLRGLSANYPGINNMVAGWKSALQNKQLDFQRIHTDLNGGEIRKGLASLYALSYYPQLGGIDQYYKLKKIKSEVLRRATENLFRELKNRAKVDFGLPSFGTSFDEKKYTLIDKNFGPIYDIDSFELKNILDQTLTPQNQRPIIDVGELGLPNPPTDTGVRFDYPRKTTIGYYSK